MEIVITFVILVLFMGSSYPFKEMPENQIILYDEVPATRVAVRHTVNMPLSKMQNANIVKQQYDFSCGSAALATVLNYYLKENLTEHQVIQGLMQYGDAKQIEQKRAFSLLDMKRFVGVLGYKGAGFTAEIDDLKTLKTPAIVPIELYGYKHFVVFRGIYEDHVFFADPNIGNTSFPVSQFLKMWYQNIVFIIADEDMKTNALALREEDLRVVFFDMDKPPVMMKGNDTLIENERNLEESFGKYLYVK